MTKQTTAPKNARTQYSQSYKDDALALAERIGFSKAATQLGILESQLYYWRNKHRLQQSSTEREQSLADENARLKRLLAEQAEELAIVKNGRSVLCQTPEIKYAFMLKHRKQFATATMSRVLSVSRSGFYAWLSRHHRPSQLRHRQQKIDMHVANAFKADKSRSGAIRVMLALEKQGIHYNRKTVALSLQRQGLRAKAARKFKATTQSKHNLPVADNLLQQDFTASQPNQKWAGDITYLWTNEGWYYLAVVLDLYSRKVIGWAMSERMTARLVCDALTMALFRRKHPKGVIVHTDRGSQYCSHDYQTLLRDNGLICSMSAKGCCYDNACSESFFHSLKVEAIHGERFETRQQIRVTVFEYIEVDYNRQRLHSYLDYKSPDECEQQKIA
jgi:transposase InsO family protein/transposase-like protein